MPFRLLIIITCSILLARLKSSNGLIATNRNIPVGDIVVAPIDVPPININPKQDDQLPTLTLDLMDLATLRYDEWIRTTNDNHQTPAPSQRAFAMATAEIAQERSQLGAIPFLAKLPQHSNNSHKAIPVGAAELSPAEFEGALQESIQSRHRWYVTDVVTSSHHRRMGIANKLMEYMEQYAYDHSKDSTTTTGDNREPTTSTTPTTLYLHVKPDNHAALQFYQSPKRGYTVPTNDELEGLDCKKLAETAGTQGQLLLCKTLTPENLPTAPAPVQQPSKQLPPGLAALPAPTPPPKRRKRPSANENE